LSDSIASRPERSHCLFHKCTGVGTVSLSVVHIPFLGMSLSVSADMADDTRPFTHSMKGEGAAKNLDYTKGDVEQRQERQVGNRVPAPSPTIGRHVPPFQLGWVNGMEYQGDTSRGNATGLERFTRLDLPKTILGLFSWLLLLLIVVRRMLSMRLPGFVISDTARAELILHCHSHRFQKLGEMLGSVR
jgi:hypothetical protein